MALNGPTGKKIRALCSLLNDIEGIETISSRAGDPQEGRFMGYVSMRADGTDAVRRLLARLGRTFAAVFHVGEQKCEMGFRVEVSTSQGELRYLLRFWGCPDWGMRRIRKVLTERVAGERDRDMLPSLEPPWSEAQE